MLFCDKGEITTQKLFFTHECLSRALSSATFCYSTFIPVQFPVFWERRLLVAFLFILLVIKDVFCTFDFVSKCVCWTCVV